MGDNILSQLIAKKILGANRIYAKPNILSQKENRPSWGVAIKLEGSTRYVCNEKEFITDSEHIAILPKGASYTWESYGGQCLLIEFDADISAETIFVFKVKDISKILDLFNKIETLRISKNDFYEIRSIDYLYRILITLFETESQKYIPSQSKNILKPSIEYINENYSDSTLSIEKLSSISKISPVYFRKLFTHVYNCPPMEYVYRLRMNKAAEMLKSDFNSIEAISTSVGYNSIYHFSKMFKRYFGVSPSSYNKMIQKNR